MNFEVETWRKLYVRLTASWLRLPVFCRGLGSELLKYADDHGRIPLFPGEAPGSAVARMLAAHADEAATVTRHVALLLADGYLVHDEDGSALVIRNYERAQARGSSAERMARKRERDREPVFARDGHTCRYCGENGGRLEIDHVVPRVQGGSDEESNLVVACHPCNARKGGRTPEQAGMTLLPSHGGS